jgi:two-component system, cell cycle sensor histidine kinase and response regulator CckA
MKKILVVDNHPVMVKFMSSLLEKAGHQVVTASDGLSALRLLETVTPDVMFIDLVMPNINGEKLCRIVRNLPQCRETYIVIVSAIAAEEHLDFKSFGADACVAKGPFHRMATYIMKLLEVSIHRDFDGWTDGIIGLEEVFQRDVTKELLVSRKHSETLLNSLSEGILELTRDGDIVFVNRPATMLLGIPEESLLGSRFAEIWDKSCGQTVTDLLQAVWEGDPPGPENSAILMNAKQISLTAMPVRDLEEPATIVILKDVTQQKRLEAHLEHAQKMDAIATLAGGVAHQFNNALFAISGNMELLQMVMPGKEIGRYVDPMKHSLDRMVHLTSQLLAYAREGKYKPEKTSLNEFIKSTIPLIRYTVDSSLDLSVDLSEGTREVEVDLAQMQMVLSALVANSKEAMEERGRVRLITRNCEVGKEFVEENPGMKPGSYVRLTIEDNGKGMTESILGRIFEPFFTTKFQGRGLGMAAAYGIIRNHGGWISVESEIDKGTAVHIYLPAVQKEVKQDPPRVNPNKCTGTIMVVEDEAPLMEISKAMLEHLGYQILEARTAREAIKLAKTYTGKIDLTMLDIGLPDMDGYSVFPIIKKARPHMKVTVCSGYALDGHAKEILNSGAQGFLQKPYTLATLSAKLREVLEGQSV